MPPAIAKIGTCKLRFCERLNLNFNIATCAGGLVSMGVRLPEKPALAQCLTHSPRAGTRISSGRASKKCRRKPRRGDRLPGGCWRFATVRRRKSNSRQAAQSMSSRRHQAKTCGGHGSATSFAIEAACGMLVDQTAAGSRAIRIHADASQMQSMWKGPSSPK